MIKTDGEVDRNQPRESEDPVLMMLGVGRQLWEQESGDSFVERLRSEDPPPSPETRLPDGASAGSTENLPETVWRRMQKHQGEQFHTARGLPFTFEVEGSGVWFFRNGRRINRKLTRAQVEVAVSRCPLTTTTEINDLMDYAYLFGVLADRRIRGKDW